MRASQIAQTYIDGNRSTARNAVLADGRPDLMALDVLTELLDRNDADGGDPDDRIGRWEDVIGSWRNCLAGGI